MRWLLTRRVFGFCLFALAAPATAQIYTEHRPGMALGMGYDGLNGDLKGQCATGTEATDASSGTGKFSWDETNTSESIRRTFEISAGLAYKALTTGASGKASLLNRSSTNRSLVNISAVNRSTTKTVRLTAVRVTKPKRDLATFRLQCGTHYVAALVWGGEFYASLSQVVSSQEERSEFEAVAQATGQTLKADLKTASSLETSRFASTVHIEGARVGGNPIVFLAPADLRVAFSAFQADVAAGKDAPVQAMLLPYSGFGADEQQKLAALEDAIVRIYTLRDFNNTLNAVMVAPSRYYVDPTSVAANGPTLSGRVQDLDRTLRTQMQKCVGPRASLRRDCNFGAFPVAPTGAASGLPDLYQSSCDSPWTPPPYGSEFAALPRLGGDEATGGSDVVEITTQYDAAAGQPLLQTTTVDIHESPPWDTRYRRTLNRNHFDVAAGSKCVLKLALAQPATSGSVGVGNNENNYMPLTFDTALVAGAICRTNQHGGDDGFAGCSSITFKPLAINLEHLENTLGRSTPRLATPAWLGPPSRRRR